jgi:hypothetical protein
MKFQNHSTSARLQKLKIENFSEMDLKNCITLNLYNFWLNEATEK